jgi:hypothetical protein
MSAPNSPHSSHTALSEPDVHADEVDTDPLSQSLLLISRHAHCPAAQDFFEYVPSHEENQPRRLLSMADSAEYFVGRDGLPLILVFPAEIDLEGKYAKSTLYFNLPPKVDVGDLKKARSVFELRLLNSTDCPDEAVRASRAAYDALVVLYNETEDKFNEFVPSTQRPVVTPCWRTYQGAEDRYTLLVQTDPVFGNIPFARNTPVPKITREQVGKAACPPSPSKNTPANASTSSTLRKLRGIHDWKLSDLPDPERRYSNLGSECLKEVALAIPDIRDSNGTLIHPRDYPTQLVQGCKVAVEVILKLWNIPAADKSKPAPATKWWRYRDGEENGSRTYQLILKRMRVLPVADITKAVFCDTILAGKRRSSETTRASDSSKRPHLDDSDPFIMIE